MRNRNVGFLIVGLSLVIGVIVLIFNMGLKSIVGETCTHGETCSMYDTIATQTYLSLTIAGVILIIGIFLILSKEHEKLVIKTRTIKEKGKKLDLSKLDKSEREVVKFLLEENGTVFQADLMEKLGIGKVGMTRLLDKLEAKQIVERKRRGMNNVVVLKK